MRTSAKHQPGKGALDLVEEATHVLRTAPAGALAAYYVGALPFVLGGLYFWADMSRSPYAYQHLAGAALGMAGLFVWMKFWQVIFARRVRAQVSGQLQPPLTLGRCGRILATQAAVQPTGLFVLTLASILVIPAGWAYAFYQNLTALDDGESGELLGLFHKARRQATLWPGQNHSLLGVLLGFATCVLFNWAAVCFMLPGLVKMLLGVESVFTRSNLAMLNTTFFAAMLALTYLCVDPILKAAYALRCFYGESVQSGEDLKAELRGFIAPARAMAVGLLLLLGATGMCQGANPPAPAGETAEAVGGATGGSDTSLKRGVNESRPQASPTSISAPKLDRTIEKVIQGSKYTWRAPREKLLEPEAMDQGILGRFLTRIWDFTKTAVKKVFHWLGQFMEWLGRWIGKLFGRFFRIPNSSAPGYGWIMSLNMLLYVLVAAVVLGFLYLGYRIWRNRRPREAVLASEPIQPLPDVADENVGADHLPEDGWVRLARELLARGELRLALRAFYLASLAHLAERNLVSIAKFKSNRDYERELLRRGHSFPELLAAFGENVAVFDRIWYGLHEVSLELVNEFAVKVGRIQGASEIVGDDVRSLINPPQAAEQSLLTSSPTDSR
jgi:hypothetical protein